MPFSNVRARRVLVSSERKSVPVFWFDDEDEKGWYWTSASTALGGGRYSLGNYVVLRDLVRFSKPKSRATRVGEVVGFEGPAPDARPATPLVVLEDLATGDRVSVDIEAVRPLFDNWDGDPPTKLALPASLTAVLDSFPSMEEANPDWTVREAMAALRAALEAAIRQPRPRAPSGATPGSSPGER